MNIQLLTPALFSNNKYKMQNQHNTSVMPLIHSELKADTVSFTAKNDNKHENKPAQAVMLDFVKNSYEKNIPEYTIYSNRLMDILESIAMKFKDRGVDFDREYCEHAPVKSTDSFVSKLIRSGSKPLDRVRSTLYVKNPHDFKLIDDIIKELDDRGYEIANVHGTRKPDFDIRLADVTQEELQGLRPELRKYVSEPLPTGYEDIQFRLKDKTKKKAPLMEVIILFGKETAEAKFNESKYSYNIRRELKDTLHIAKVKNPEVNSPAYRVKNNIKVISNILCSHISIPLFTNAKNADYLNDSFRQPVELSKSNCLSLNGLAEGIRDKIPLYYKTEIEKVKNNDYDEQLVTQIKNSPMYKEREDKTIYSSDIAHARQYMIEELKRHRMDDLDTIIKVKKNISVTIDKYGPKTEEEIKS